MDKEGLLSNVAYISALDLFKAIEMGAVTLKDLEETGELKPNKRAELEKIIKKHEIELEGVKTKRLSDEADEWENLRYSLDILRLNEFIAKYQPDGKFIQAAKDWIKRIEKEIQKKQYERNQILNTLKTNRNYYTVFEIQKYLQQNVVADCDLIECGIPQAVISKVRGFRKLDINLGKTPETIPAGFTEVYFWGIPGSGKTCALSAILNTAQKHGYSHIGRGTGTGYTLDLTNLFRTDDNLGYLPEGTAINRTQYLPVMLKDSSEEHWRSVSLIELSGEVFKCFCRRYIDHDEHLGDMDETFAMLDRFLLNTNNRKMHFFFIDYDPSSIAQDRFTQANYINSAVSYFQEKKIFAKSTDAIYLVITKSDLIDGWGTNEELLNKSIDNYLKDNFKAFENYLSALCKKENINGGKYTVLPFSIGEVFFKRICKINRVPSEMIIDILFSRIKPQKKSIFDVFKK